VSYTTKSKAPPPNTSVPSASSETGPKSNETASGGDPWVLTQYGVIRGENQFGKLWECFLVGNTTDLDKLPLEPGQALQKIGSPVVRIFTVKPYTI
jgi:hypothetical protein